MADNLDLIMPCPAVYVQYLEKENRESFFSWSPAFWRQCIDHDIRCCQHVRSFRTGWQPVLRIKYYGKRS